jgi:hypothetical protein
MGTQKYYIYTGFWQNNSQASGTKITYFLISGVNKSKLTKYETSCKTLKVSFLYAKLTLFNGNDLTVLDETFTVLIMTNNICRCALFHIVHYMFPFKSLP